MATSTIEIKEALNIKHGQLCFRLPILGSTDPALRYFTRSAGVSKPVRLRNEPIMISRTRKLFFSRSLSLHLLAVDGDFRDRVIFSVQW